MDNQEGKIPQLKDSVVQLQDGQVCRTTEFEHNRVL